VVRRKRRGVSADDGDEFVTQVPSFH
jgi:hypothetical protein